MKRKKPLPKKKAIRSAKSKGAKKRVTRKKAAAVKARKAAPRKKGKRKSEADQEYESSVAPFLAGLVKEGVDAKPFKKCRTFFAVLNVLLQETDEASVREVIAEGLEFIQPKFDFTPYVESLLVAVKTNDEQSYDEINELAILRAFGA